MYSKTSDFSSRRAGYDRRWTSSLLERGEEALGDGVFVAVALGAHRAGDAGVVGSLAEAAADVLGGFMWSSQHLEREELRWAGRSGVDRIGRCVRRSVRLAGRESRGVRIASGSGRRLPRGSRVTGLACSPAC